MSFITEDLLEFIYQNQEKDSYRLALQRDRYPSSFWEHALPAIQARQKLAKKIPLWAEYPRVFISDPTIVEQASSWETSEYKASLISRDCILMDMTGGMGSDTYAFSQRASKAIYLEYDADRVEAARHNFGVLGADIPVYHGSAEVEGLRLAEEYHPDVIFIDPDRRPSEEHKRVFTLQDSLPDVLSLIPKLRIILPQASILLKLSPMMDLTQTESLLGSDCDVHVVSLRREAKELLLHFRPGGHYTYNAIEVMSNRCLRITAPKDMAAPPSISNEVGSMLFDLYPSVSKLGYGRFSLPYSVWQPALHTHLFFSDTDDAWEDFPGRAFRVIEAGEWDKKTIKRLTQKPLHLVAKNFPILTDKLRTQLKVKEGGDLFLFAYMDEARASRFVLAKPL